MSKQDLSALAVLVVVILAVLAVVRAARSRPSPQRDTPTPPQPQPDDADPVCGTRGCQALATRGRPDLVQRRPLGALAPRWEVVDDPEAEPVLCRAHHGVWTAHLRRLAVAEAAALEEHLAAAHQRLVGVVAVDLPKTLAFAPQAPRPSPLRGSTLAPPSGAPEGAAEARSVDGGGTAG